MKQIEDILREYIKVTNEGKLQWRKQNATTLFVDKQHDDGTMDIVSIQLVDPLVDNYVFNVKRNGEIVIEINTSIFIAIGLNTVSTETKQLIKQLFDAVKSSLDRKGFDILTGFINDNQ